MSCFHPSPVEKHLDWSWGNKVLWISALLETWNPPTSLQGFESRGENAAVCSEHEALLVGLGDWDPSLLLHLGSGAVPVAVGELEAQLSPWSKGQGEPFVPGRAWLPSHHASSASPTVASLLGNNELNFFSLN